MWPVAFIQCSLHLSFSSLSTEALSARPLATFESKQTPAGLPILDCRSPVRLPLPSSSWIYASIVSHTSWSISTSWLRSLNRKRRGKAEIRTADLHIHDLENVSALDRSTTVGRLLTICFPDTFIGDQVRVHLAGVDPPPTPLGAVTQGREVTFSFSTFNTFWNGSHAISP